MSSLRFPSWPLSLLPLLLPPPLMDSSPQGEVTVVEDPRAEGEVVEDSGVEKEGVASGEEGEGADTKVVSVVRVEDTKVVSAVREVESGSSVDRGREESSVAEGMEERAVGDVEEEGVVVVRVAGVSDCSFSSFARSRSLL